MSRCHGDARASFNRETFPRYGGGDESLFLFNYKIFAIYPPPPLSNKRGGKGKVAFRVNRPIKESVALLDNVELCQPFRGLHSIRSDLHSPTERKRRGYPSTFERTPPPQTHSKPREETAMLSVRYQFVSISVHHLFNTKHFMYT